MDEDTWIRTNIRQRKCTVFSRGQEETFCKCWRSKSEHQDPDSKNDEDWSTLRNTASEPCRNYGKIYFGEEGKTSQYVRIDVESDMSIAEHLLLEVWRLPKPKWMFSFIGETHNQDDAQEKEKEIRCQLKGLMKSFSNGQNIWITTEGIDFGIAKMIGDYIKDEPSNNITPLGVYAWAGVENEVIKELETEKPQLPERKQGNRPSALYKHHLLVDDGSLNPSHAHKSFQGFRMRLETSMTKHSEGTSSIPLVAVLYCGWSYVLDGVQSAIENNVPVVVLKGTGGMADVFASVFINSKEDRTSSSGDSEKEWTGTVIDDVLRDRVKEESTKVHEQMDEAGQYKILQCLQKRELITVVHIDEKETTLVNEVIQALLKSKTVPEVLQILDYYMPARLFDGEGAAAAALNIQEQRKHLSETTGMFLLQAILRDEAEIAQFIIDHNGVDLKTFLTDAVISDLCEETGCAQLETSFKQPPRCSDEPDLPKKEVFRRLMMWALHADKPKCAALFWKKGTHLLTASLLAVSVLRFRMKNEENIGSQKTIKAQAELFQSRAIGLMNTCYDVDKGRTMEVIQSQIVDNIWHHDLLRSSLSANNRRIFATEAYREYTELVFFGQINPPIQVKHNVRKKMTPKRNRTGCARLGRLVMAPVTTYILNLLFYVCFLGLFGHTLLFEMKKEFSVLEGILVGWWFTFVWEEIRQIVTIKQSEQAYCCRDKCQCCYRWKLSADFSGYFFDNYWNILDCVSLGFFLIGAVLMTLVHLDTSRNYVYEAARVILSLDIMLFTWRILQHLAIFRIMGPILEMILQMIKDLFPFLVIMSVFIIAQGMAAHALLYPNRDWSFEALRDIPKSAFWNLFGELGLDEIEASETQGACSSNPLLFENDTLNECPSTLGKYAVPLLLALHMLLLNVLLLNILIARFSFTFQMIHNQTEWLAAWQKLKVTLEYYSKPLLPPPFNVIFDVVYFLYGCCKSVEVAPKEANDENEEMESWERSMGEYYLATDEFKSGSKRSSSEVASSDNRMDFSKIEDIVGSLRKQIQSIKSDLKETVAVCKEMRQVMEQYGPRSTETPRRAVTLHDCDGQEENA